MTDGRHLQGQKLLLEGVQPVAEHWNPEDARQKLGATAERSGGGDGGWRREQARRPGRSIRRAKSARGTRAELSSEIAARRRQSPARSRSASMVASPRSRTTGTRRTIPWPTPSNPDRKST